MLSPHVWWKAGIGSAIVLFALSEMFQDLFHPSRSGALSDSIAHRIFVILRRWPQMLGAAGPAAVVSSIAAWSCTLVVGFALIYWSVFPWAFQLQTANRPTGSDDFWWCLYYSLEMLTTLGLGDIQPIPNWLRLLSAVHTLVGFSLVTASITWIVLIFPALGRTRTLARKAHVFSTAQERTGVSLSSPGFDVAVGILAEEVIRARVDLIHFPIIFYFDTTEANASLASAVRELKRFADNGTDHPGDDKVRFAAHTLQQALRDLADKLQDRLSMEGSTDEVFRAFAEFHRKLPSEE